MFHAVIEHIKGCSVWNNVWYSVWYSVWNTVYDTVYDIVFETQCMIQCMVQCLKHSVWYSVWYSVWNTVYDTVYDTVFETLCMALRQHCHSTANLSLDSVFWIATDFQVALLINWGPEVLVTFSRNLDSRRRILVSESSGMAARRCWCTDRLQLSRGLHGQVLSTAVLLRLTTALLSADV